MNYFRVHIVSEVEVEMEVLLSHVQLFVTPETAPPGPSVHGILQARILGWVAISFSREPLFSN